MSVRVEPVMGLDLQLLQRLAKAEGEAREEWIEVLEQLYRRVDEERVKLYGRTIVSFLVAKRTGPGFDYTANEELHDLLRVKGIWGDLPVEATHSQRLWGFAPSRGWRKVDLLLTQADTHIQNGHTTHYGSLGTFLEDTRVHPFDLLAAVSAFWERIQDELGKEVEFARVQQACIDFPLRLAELRQTN